MLPSEGRKSKSIKKIAKIGLVVVLVLFTIPALSLLFLQNRQVQTALSKYLAGQLAEELETTISLSSVSYTFFKRIQVTDLYIEDQHGDTLLFSGLTKFRIKRFRPDRNQVEIRRATFEDAYVNFVIGPDGMINLKFITDRLSKPHVPPEKKNRLTIAGIELINGRFSLSTRDDPASVKQGVDFADLDLGNLAIRVKDLEIYRDTIRMHIADLSGIEKSGFEIGWLSSHLELGKKHLQFNELSIDTEGSRLRIPELSLNFDNYGVFRDFANEVKLKLTARHSILAMDDVTSFIQGVGGVLDRVTIDGSLSGTLSDLRGEDLFVTFDDRSSLAFDFIMIGLPDFEHTFIDFNFRQLNTSFDALASLRVAQEAANLTEPTPLTKLGNLVYRGRFTGYPDHFVANGLLVSDLGNMVMDLSFRPDSLRGLSFNGRLRTNNFRLGTFLGQEEYLAGLDMDIYADGTLNGKEIRANLDGVIDTLEFYDYAYSNITVDGAFTNNTFDGLLSISDPNIRLDFLGKMDFSGEVPVYNFTADVARARPFYLNLPQEDPNYFASFLIETDLSGRTLDEMNGEIRLVNSLFEKTDAQLQLYDLTVLAKNTPDTSLLQVRSELFDSDITGRYRMTELPASFRNMADRFVDVIPGHPPRPDSLNRFVYRLDFKRVGPLLDFFFPVLGIGDRSMIYGRYDPSRSEFTTTGYMPLLRIAGNTWHNVDLFTGIDRDVFTARFQSDSMTFGEELSLVDQQFYLKASGDTAKLNVTWDNRLDPVYRGNINLFGSFENDTLEGRNFKLGVQPSTFYVDNEEWKIHGSSIQLKKSYLQVDSLIIESRNEYFLADGAISSETEDQFNLDIRNLNLARLAPMSGMNLKLLGNITGNFNYRKVDQFPHITTDLTVDTLWFNGQKMGPTFLDALWNESRGTIVLDLLSQGPDSRGMEVHGDYTPAGGLLDFDIQLNEFDLRSVDPYVKGLFSDLSGQANVKLTLDGSIREPELNGTVRFNEGETTISMLGTRYRFSDQLRIYHNNIYLEDFLLSDATGNSARIDGSISNNYLKDLFINLKIEATNLMALNTTAEDNETYYGRVFATGNVVISGPPEELSLRVDARTGRNTAIYLPLYTASEVQRTDFITFISDRDMELHADAGPQKKTGGMSMEMEISITPDAVVQLIFDPRVGDIIETSGRGDLRIELDPDDGFSIFGDVVLQTGEYLFTLQNVINKRFQIEPGGRINFNGSPTNATVDLNAIYTTRAAPYNLYPGGQSQMREKLKKRIPVECHLTLQGELNSPRIGTGIEMPTADPETRNLLINSTSTEEERMKQFLSLLVINNFYSVTGMGVVNVGTMNSSIAGVTASELLSNQLSNWLSQISDDFDIGVNYRPGDQISSDEVEVALSTQLLNDRIIISGNVDVGGQETNPSSGASNNPYIVGDFDVEFLVTDNISITAFNRARDELLFETAPYKQGVGISYREEFNNFRELIKRFMGGLINRKKKNKNSLPPETDE
ncbi:MAG TPA: translocation/assembly module TamB [Bacteroides sp.]|nr:translocation/assembly module TamB [Bacteroides sp.]